MHDLESRLRTLVSESAWLVDLLTVVRDVGPVDAYVAAGAVRDTVWNALTGRSLTLSGDVDVVFFDPDATDLDGAAADRALQAARPSIRWEVTNQAHVHRWYRGPAGADVPPFASVAHAMARWPETATAVGARLATNGVIQIVAPLGLEDLFALTVRHNPAHLDGEAYASRVASKRWLQRWPELTFVESTRVVSDG